MNDRITCFKLNWYDCGLACADDAVQEEITIYRNEHRLVFKELNGYGVICSCVIIPTDIDNMYLFSFPQFRPKLMSKMGKAQS